MINRYDYIIGIDPDVNKSGIAVLNMKNLSLLAINMTIPELFQYLQKQKEELGFFLVIVEASWATKHNWHLHSNTGKAKAAAQGYDVGRNHQTGIIIVDFCKYIGLNVKEQSPLKKCWSAPDKKITHDEITQITNWNYKRSNQEVRDAALLAWAGANLPIKITVKKKVK